MPIVSEAQRRLMYAAAAGKSKKVPVKVAKEFIKAGAAKDLLPERKKKNAN